MQASIPALTVPTGSLRSLARFPFVLRRLEERGVLLERGEGESPDHAAARVETALMALFRDEPSNRVFEALHELSRRSLASWVVSCLRTRRLDVDPLEVVQDTYVNIYRYAAGFRDDQPSSFRVWARTIAANLVRRLQRNRASRASLQALPEGLQEPEDLRGGPEQDVLDAEHRRRLGGAWRIVLAHYAAAFEALSERDRRALELVELEDLSYAEAAERLGVRLSNMKMIVFRARKRIRERIRRVLVAAHTATTTRRAG